MYIIHTLKAYFIVFYDIQSRFLKVWFNIIFSI